MTAARHAVMPVPHACARAYERYGLTLTNRDLWKICNTVQNNLAKLDRINNNKTTQWFLTYNNIPVRVIISADFYRVVTFLPLEDNRRPRAKRKRRKLYRNGKPFWIEASP